MKAVRGLLLPDFVESLSSSSSSYSLLSSSSSEIDLLSSSSSLFVNFRFLTIEGCFSCVDERDDNDDVDVDVDDENNVFGLLLVATLVSFSEAVGDVCCVIVLAAVDFVVVLVFDFSFDLLCRGP